MPMMLGGNAGKRLSSHQGGFGDGADAVASCSSAIC